MARMVYLREELRQMLFARKAARAFEQHPEYYSYGKIEEGEFLALRWGLGEDCVLVLKLDEYHVPTNYQQLIKKGVK